MDDAGDGADDDADRGEGARGCLRTSSRRRLLLIYVASVCSSDCLDTVEYCTSSREEYIRAQGLSELSSINNLRWM